jgi:uncharacterized membrane protein
LQSAINKAYLILAIIGIGDVCYLSYEYITANFTTCSFNNSIFSCEMVALSGHTSLLGIPFWVMGIAWFPLCLAFGLLAFRYGGEIILILFLMIGNIFTVYLWYLELAVIHYICLVCVSLYLVNYTLTGLILWNELYSASH